MAAPKKAMPKPKPATAANAKPSRRKLSNAEMDRRDTQLNKSWDILDAQQKRLGGRAGVVLQTRNFGLGGGKGLGQYGRADGFYDALSRQKVTRLSERQIRAEAGANRGSGTRKTGAKNKGF